MKRLFDCVAAFCGLLVLSPLFLLIGCLVKISSEGPIIYQQKRVGKAGKTFTIFKFRSMLYNSGRHGIDVISNKDPRITKVGRIFRATRLDELPQLWNVLRGDMSIVGPRPYRCEVAALFSHERSYEPRLTVRPGITGLAKVAARNGNTETEIRADLKIDCIYVHRRCIFLDLWIILKTPGVMWRRVGI